MKATTNDYELELNNDLIQIRNLKTKSLVKAFTVPALTAVDRFNELVLKIKNSNR